MINSSIKPGNPDYANWLCSIKTRLPKMNQTLNKQVEYGKLILQTLSAKLNLNHFKDIIHIDNSLKRMFSAKLLEQSEFTNPLELTIKNNLEVLGYGE